MQRRNRIKISTTKIQIRKMKTFYAPLGHKSHLQSQPSCSTNNYFCAKISEGSVN